MPDAELFIAPGSIASSCVLPLYQIPARVIPPTELVIATCPYLLIPTGDTSDPRSVSVKTCAEAKLATNRKTVIALPWIFNFVPPRQFPIVNGMRTAQYSPKCDKAMVRSGNSG